MKLGIILAGGRGSRLKSKTKNKTSLELAGKPLVLYGVALFKGYTDKTVIVTGAFAQSVKDVVKGEKIIFAQQTKRLGTGHAVKVAVLKISKNKISPKIAFVGYGDHMMRYSKQVLKKLETVHTSKKAAITLISTTHPYPNELAWGRIVRDVDDQVLKIVEQKDATSNERRITEVNAGFYCFDYAFLQQNIKFLKKSSVTNEYYLTDLIALARQENLPVYAVKISFDLVGVGINTREDLEKYQEKSSFITQKVSTFLSNLVVFPKPKFIFD